MISQICPPASALNISPAPAFALVVVTQSHAHMIGLRSAVSAGQHQGEQQISSIINTIEAVELAGYVVATDGNPFDTVLCNDDGRIFLKSVRHVWELW
jgi:hypothetical protein